MQKSQPKNFLEGMIITDAASVVQFCLFLHIDTPWLLFNCTLFKIYRKYFTKSIFKTLLNLDWLVCSVEIVLFCCHIKIRFLKYF